MRGGTVGRTASKNTKYPWFEFNLALRMPTNLAKFNLNFFNFD